MPDLLGTHLTILQESLLEMPCQLGRSFYSHVQGVRGAHK